MGEVEKEAIRVVLVDDHNVVRKGVRRLLDREQDIEVVGEASNGREALVVIKELNPDVVVLDMEMPVMDGFGVMRQLNEDKVGTRVLVLSAHTEQYYVSGVLECGAAGYLSKHDGPDQVVDAVRRVAQGETLF